MPPSAVSSKVHSFSTERKSKFILARLHSLSGLLPLGFFLVEHLISNSLSIFGADRYNEHIRFLQSIPFLPFFEVFLIALPLFFHGIYGIYLSFISKPNTHVYKYKRNINFLLQRVTGAVTIVFVSYHVWSFRVAPALNGSEINHQLVSGHLGEPLIFLFYVLGVLSAVFHFTNGISTGLITWGITIGPEAQKAARTLCYILFILLGAISVASLVSFVLV